MRVAIYCRVSTEEQLEGYSIQAQSRACRDYADGKAWTVTQEYVDQGKSARVDDIAKRPAFQQMMADAVAKSFDLLLVHKIDRFSRNRRVAFDSFDKLGKAGVGFVSLSENMDFSAPWGQFALTMLVGLAQLFSDNLSQETKKGKRERKAQGLYNGLLPYGVVKGDDGLPVPDRRPQPNGSTNYDGLIVAFEAAADGKTDVEIARILNARGYRTSGHFGANVWRKDSVRRVLINRFYLGELPAGKLPAMPGKHAPLLDLDLWQRAQAARRNNLDAHASLSVNHHSTVHALSGLLRCWYCEQSGDPRRGAMRIGPQHGSQPRATCYSRYQGLDCPQRSAFVSVYDSAVGLWLALIHLSDDALDNALVRIRAEQRAEHGKNDTETERRSLEAALNRLPEVYLWGHLDKSAYLAQREQLTKRLAELQPSPRRADELQALAAVAQHVAATWQIASPAERNELAHQLIEKVIVKDGQVVEIIPRPAFLDLLGCQHSSYTGGSDGIRPHLCKTGRYSVPRSDATPLVVLKAIASELDGQGVKTIARDLGVSRQTVRKARDLYR